MTSTDFATNRPESPRIGVAIKFVPLRVEVNPLTGAVSADDRLSGASPADEAALEYGLRLAESLGLGRGGRLGRRPTMRADAAGRARPRREQRGPGGPAGRCGVPGRGRRSRGGPGRLRPGALRRLQPEPGQRLGAGVPGRPAVGGAGAGAGVAD